VVCRITTLMLLPLSEKGFGFAFPVDCKYTPVASAGVIFHPFPYKKSTAGLECRSPGRKRAHSAVFSNEVFGYPGNDNVLYHNLSNNARPLTGSRLQFHRKLTLPVYYFPFRSTNFSSAPKPRTNAKAKPALANHTIHVIAATKKKSAPANARIELIATTVPCRN
jgi:hypothetical protein